MACAASATELDGEASGRDGVGNDGAPIGALLEPGFAVAGQRRLMPSMGSVSGAVVSAP